METAAPRRSSGRPPAGAASVRDALLRSAATHFSKYGFAGANIRAILADAGTTAPAMYHHFGNKTGLYIAAATEAQSHVLEVFGAVLDGRPNLADRVTALLAAAVRLREEHPNVAKYLSVVQQDAVRHPELGELTSYEEQFDELWHVVAGDSRGRGMAVAVRAIIEGLLAVGGSELSAAAVSAAADVLQQIVNGGLAGLHS